MKLSDCERSRLSRMTIALFDYWNLSAQERLSLLGVSSGNKEFLNGYRKGAPLANDRIILERVSILLGIHKSLRVLFPNNRELVYSWMTKPNLAFEGLTPIQVIELQGLIGLYIIRAYLNRQSS